MEGAPPSYDDVVQGHTSSGSVQPSAPQLADLPPPSAFIPTAAYTDAATVTGEQRITFQDSSRMKRVVDAYVRYSMAHHLRRYITPKSDRLDPELDVEAQFSRRTVRDAQSGIARKERMRYLTGWLWCFGVVLVALYVILPIAMLCMGGFGFSDCSYKSGAIITYLLLGGCLVLAVVLTRSIPSCMTGCMNRNYFNSQDDSFKFTRLICICEVCFYMVVVGNVIVLFLGTVWIFQGHTPICSKNMNITDNCCSFYVYTSGAFFNVFQYLLYLVTLLYAGSVICCIRVADKNSKTRS